ncbi:MAG: LytTR family DNA-binding domain-containing protein [Paramuribaculum sp.]|nr:LytTR family DNA-binding domain-containing protein [Paramuribaculum sp.]MDE6323076.1 LytTR family DNA-binding domain-containing protein [Paramuribaculum sp.]
MSGKISCVAIDDEPLALAVIEKFCQRMGGVDLKTFSNPETGLEYIRSNNPCIAFLDVEMEGLNGIRIAQQLPEGTCFIFTTAYLQYTLDGYDLDAVDYLHKPFAYSRFQAAFSKAVRRIGRQPLKASGQTVVVKQDYYSISIPVDDILYVEAMEGYSKIFRVSGECVVTRMILKNLAEMLPDDTFLRIHRSFIISRTKIRNFNRQEIYLTDGTAVPVGRRYAASIVDILKA